MARKVSSERDLAAANIVTIADIALRCGVGEETVSRWRDSGMASGYGFPGALLPAAAGGVAAWWWPDIREFIEKNRSFLAAAMPLLEPEPRDEGKRGPKPVLDPFSIAVARAMRGQADDQGRPRYTARQIAAAMPYPVNVSAIHLHAPDPEGPGRRGGDRNTLPPGKIAELRELRSRTRPDGNPEHTLRELAARFGISASTAGRYCRDIQVGDAGRPRARRGPVAAAGAGGQPLTSEQVHQVQVLRAERDSAGNRLRSVEDVAAMTGIPARTITLLDRGLTGQGLPALAFPAPPRPRPGQPAPARRPVRNAAAPDLGSQPRARPGA